jgi:hypothetical protein
LAADSAPFVTRRGTLTLGRIEPEGQGMFRAQFEAVVDPCPRAPIVVLRGAHGQLITTEFMGRVSTEAGRAGGVIRGSFSVPESVLSEGRGTLVIEAVIDEADILPSLTNRTESERQPWTFRLVRGRDGQ